MTSRQTSSYGQASTEFDHDSKELVGGAIDERMEPDSKAGRATGMTGRQVVDRINDVLGYDSEAEPGHVSDWRNNPIRQTGVRHPGWLVGKLGHEEKENPA